MDSFFIFFDRIYRMNWIFLRSPEETVQITSAQRREFSNRMSKIKQAMVCRLKVEINSTMIVVITLSAKRFNHFRFLPETGNLKHPK